MQQEEEQHYFFNFIGRVIFFFSLIVEPLLGGKLLRVVRGRDLSAVDLDEQGK